MIYHLASHCFKSRKLWRLVFPWRRTVRYCGLSSGFRIRVGSIQSKQNWLSAAEKSWFQRLKRSPLAFKTQFAPRELSLYTSIGPTVESLFEHSFVNVRENFMRSGKMMTFRPCSSVRLCNSNSNEPCQGRHEVQSPCGDYYCIDYFCISHTYKNILNIQLIWISAR